MDHRPRVLRSTGDFRVENGAILLSRLGPANAQRQRHNTVARDPITGHKLQREDNEPYRSAWPAPESRGYWAFPYPFAEMFFCAHVYERYLPKRLRTAELLARSEGDAALREELWKARALCMDAIESRVRTKLVWHRGPFHAMVAPSESREPRMWHRYENARDYVVAARALFAHDRSPNGFGGGICKDIMQIFVPAGGAHAARSARGPSTFVHAEDDLEDN